MMMSACFASSCTTAVCNCVSNNKSKESDDLAVSEARRETEDKRSIRTVFNETETIYLQLILLRTGKTHSSYSLLVYAYGDYRSRSKQGHRSIAAPAGF
jgi:hypothetical protein